MTIFVEHYFCEEEFWHWKYRYAFTTETRDSKGFHELWDEVYDWCLFNLDHVHGWHVRNEGVIIYNEEDAMAFKLRWL